jgi:hypothetical protein
MFQDGHHVWTATQPYSGFFNCVVSEELPLLDLDVFAELVYVCMSLGRAKDSFLVLKGSWLDDKQNEAWVQSYYI